MAGTNLEKTLPTSYYLSEEIFALEKERIFFREWFCAGRDEELPETGSYLALDVLGEQILVTRTKQGDLRAFYNVCRHRGARLCAAALSHPTDCRRPEPSGKLAGAIRCPYHSWTYGLDGNLLSAPHLGVEESFRREEFPLYPVGLDTWGGFFFLYLTPGKVRARSRSLEAQLGAVPERLKRYPLGDLRTARRIVYEVAANWKVLAENYNECYHCGPVHPELCEIVPAFRQHGGGRLAWEEGIPHRPGATTFTRTGTTSRRYFPGLNEEEKVRHKGEILYPNFLLSLSSDHVAAFTIWPLAAGRTRIACSFLFHPDEMARPQFDLSDAVEFWDLVNRQDWRICEEVQRGMQTRVHRFGYYAPMEDQSLDIRRYVHRRIGRPPAR
jgi:Rieske 2Fe-2S family protein